MHANLADQIRSVVAQYPAVMLAYLFGSQATGTTGPLSDVDVAVYLDESNDEQRFRLRLTLMSELTQALKRNDVEVVVLNDVEKPEFAYFVVRDGVCVYEREPFRVLVEPQIMSRYLDFVTSLRQLGLTKA